MRLELRKTCQGNKETRVSSVRDIEELLSSIAEKKYFNRGLSIYFKILLRTRPPPKFLNNLPKAKLPEILFLLFFRTTVCSAI